MALTLSIDMPDGTKQNFAPDDSRLGPLRDFAKGCKQDSSHKGMYSGVDLTGELPQGFARLILEVGATSEKTYLVPTDLLPKLQDYLIASDTRIWNKKWNKAESDLMAGFSDQIPKDGT